MRVFPTLTAVMILIVQPDGKSQESVYKHRLKLVWGPGLAVVLLAMGIVLAYGMHSKT